MQGETTCTVTNLTSSDVLSVLAHSTFPVNYSCIKPYIGGQGYTNVLDQTVRNPQVEAKYGMQKDMNLGGTIVMNVNSIVMMRSAY